MSAADCLRDASAERLFAGPGEMRARCRGLDWSSTPLGPVAGWPVALRMAVNLCLDAGGAACVYAGPAHVLVYNDAFVSALGAGKHPHALGRPASEVWPEVWSQLSPEFAQVFSGGAPIRHDDHRLVLERDGRLEETFWTYTVSPVRTEEGLVTGLYCVLAETTARVQAEAVMRASEERQAFLLKLSDALRPLADAGEIRAEANRALGEHLETDRTYYVELDHARGLAIVERDHVRGGAPSLAGTHPMAAFEAVLATQRAGHPFVCDDAASDPRIGDVDRQAYLDRGLRSFITVPLIKGGELVGTMSLTCGASRAWRPSEVSLVQEVAERTWEAVERSRAENRLRVSEQRFRTLVGNVHDHVIMLLDPDGIITAWTGGSERVLGYTAEEAIGQNLAMFSTPEDIASGAAARELTEAAETGRAEREGWLVRKSGERIWANEVVTAVRDDAGLLRGFTKIGRDMTTQKVIDEERARVLVREQEARREAEQAMVLRDEFLAVVSHELRTPLSSILLWSKMLRAGALTPAQQPRAFASIETSAEAQKKLIEDLLDVSRMLSGQMQLGLQVGEVRPVLEAAVAAVRPMAEARHIALALDLGGERVVARIDPDRLQQIVWNLVSNAVKFNPDGGSVGVLLTSDGATVRITVTDTGQGISPAFLPHVFERFRQQDASRTRAHGGLGLGLAITRQLVELHGGTITAASAGEGRGATFTVELPRLTLEGATDAPPSILDGSALVAPFEPDPALDGTRVLLVEDDAPTRHVLRWLLEQHGALVTAVALADEALAAIDAPAQSGARALFDVLVSDIGLPGKDGYSLLAELRQRPSVAALPALAVTAYARQDDRRRVMAAGFDAYLSKPVEPRTLVEAVISLAKGMTPPSETR